MSKYLKLFNTYLQYLNYIEDLVNFVKPNVSACKDSPNVAYFNPSSNCLESTQYTLVGNPTYPSTVAANATSFLLSFDYISSYTNTSCNITTTSGSETVTILILENLSASPVTRSGTYSFYGIEIPYSLTLEGVNYNYLERYLTFDILSDGTITWKAKGNVTKTISYSINNGEWTEITSSTDGVSINVNTGDKVRFKGTNTKYGTSKDHCSSFGGGGTAHYNVEGNIMSLIGGDNFSNLTSFTEAWAFHGLFDGANVVSALNLKLPVTTLTNYCYRALFANCESLTTPPELPATTLAEGCYWYMFSGDDNLTTAPELPATTLVIDCYRGMFYQCSSLTTAPDLLAEVIPTGAYYSIFEACSQLSYIRCLATNISAVNSTYYFTRSVANSGTFVKNPSMTSWTTGNNGIPSGWTVEDDQTV